MRDSRFWLGTILLRGDTSVHRMLEKNTTRHKKSVWWHIKPAPRLNWKLPIVHFIISMPKCDCYQLKGRKSPKFLFSLLFHCKLLLSHLWHLQPLNDQFIHSYNPKPLWIPNWSSQLTAEASIPSAVTTEPSLHAKSPISSYFWKNPEWPLNLKNTQL